ncbi:hypothetical protein [Rheinheimera baltica]|uniref:hypothetical protein n=1 Tax=Rheinheimera baltica TaxID=67576 RepID=UPI00273D21CE|nr:hypothetical protein [Rheinheimera baltica]MDP5190449.1 hypothetical protein [Rheinheimera baltica]
MSGSEKPEFEKKLLVSCAEAVGLFAFSDKNSQKELRLSINQSFSTSNTEALQMGYCKGVIDAIMQLEPHCRYDSWYPIAERLVGEGGRSKNVIEYIKSEC